MAHPKIFLILIPKNQCCVLVGLFNSVCDLGLAIWDLRQSRSAQQNFRNPTLCLATQNFWPLYVHVFTVGEIGYFIILTLVEGFQGYGISLNEVFSIGEGGGSKNRNSRLKQRVQGTLHGSFVEDKRLNYSQYKSSLSIGQTISKKKFLHSWGKILA